MIAVCRLVVSVILIFLAICDVKSRQIPVWGVIIGCLAGIVRTVILSVTGELDVFSVIISVLPGIVLFVIYVLCPGKVGAGDAPVLIMALLGADITSVYMAIIFMTIVSVAVAFVMVILGRKNSSIPYVPVITSGSIFSMIYVYLGSN